MAPAGSVAGPFGSYCVMNDDMICLLSRATQNWAWDCVAHTGWNRSSRRCGSKAAKCLPNLTETRHRTTNNSSRYNAASTAGFICLLKVMYPQTVRTHEVRMEVLYFEVVDRCALLPRLDTRDLNALWSF